MAAKELWDYLSPTYLTKQISLSTPTPQKILVETGGRKQASHYMDDASCEVISLSSAFSFNVTLQWDYLSAADAGSLMDFYFSSDYAYGKRNLFKWSHPSDSHTYVARFDCELERTIQAPELHSFRQVRLRIVGGAPTYRLSVNGAAQGTAAGAVTPRLRAVCIANAASQNLKNSSLTLGP